MLPLALTLLLLAVWWLVTAVVVKGPLVERFVLAAVGASGQIVVTVTALGAVGWLTTPALSAVNVIIAAALIVVALRSPARTAGPSGLVLADVRAIRAGVRAARGWDTIALVVVLCVAAAWLATVITWYPPRGVDDLVYHLPPVYQAAQDHKLSILPLKIRDLFAFPLNGELTFLWTVLLGGSTRWVDAPPALFAALGVAAVYALARRFGASPRGAALAGGLFGAAPVVLLQAASNYIDLIASVWLLAAAVALLRYEADDARLALGLAGLATGLVAGSKYLMLPLALALSALALVAILRRESGRRRRAAAAASFVLPALAACGYWYVRNWLQFGNPLYPLPVRAFGATIFQGPWEHSPSTWSVLLKNPLELFRIAAWDPGLGSYHGGFGFFFWGCAAPALAFAAVRILREDGWRRPARLIVLALAPLGMATLFVSPHADLWLAVRFVIFVGGVVFAAAALMIDSAAARVPGAATALRAAAVLAACLSPLAAAQATWPSVDLRPLAGDPPEIRKLTESRYLSVARWDIGPMSVAWAPLDAMTRGGAGLSVYQAAGKDVFWTAPTFGVELQNRVWNFQEAPAGEPDAFLYHSADGEPLYVGKAIPRSTVAVDPRYRLVAASENGATTLYVSVAALAEKGRQARLAQYYRLTAPRAVAATARTVTTMTPGSVVLVPFPLAAGFVVHQVNGELKADVEPIVPGDLLAVVQRYGRERVVYTLDMRITGMNSEPVQTYRMSGKGVTLVRNAPIPAAASPSGEKKP